MNPYNIHVNSVIEQLDSIITSIPELNLNRSPWECEEVNALAVTHYVNPHYNLRPRDKNTLIGRLWEGWACRQYLRGLVKLEGGNQIYPSPNREPRLTLWMVRNYPFQGCLEQRRTPLWFLNDYYVFQL